MRIDHQQAELLFAVFVMHGGNEHPTGVDYRFSKLLSCSHKDWFERGFLAIFLKDDICQKQTGAILFDSWNLIFAFYCPISRFLNLSAQTFHCHSSAPHRYSPLWNRWWNRTCYDSCKNRSALLSACGFPERSYRFLNWGSSQYVWQTYRFKINSLKVG